jgi:Carboxypeptidase regulatory-like domain
MKTFSLFLFSVLLLCSTSGFAQNSIIAGKITDDKDEPVTGAIVKVSKGGVAIEVRTDGDGLFYTRLLTPDNYHIDIRTNQKTYKTKVKVKPQDKKRMYYYFKLMGDRVYVTTDGRDPFMKAKLSKLLNDDPLRSIFYEGRTYFSLRVDSISGKGSVLYRSPDPAPRIYDRVVMPKR